MRYDFDEQVNSTYTSTAKWKLVKEFFGEEDLIPLWVAEMDFKLPPPIIDALKKKAEEGIFGYTMPPDSLFEVLSKWLDKKHDWQVDKEAISHTPGVIPTMNACVQAFTEPGERIVIQPPVYAPFTKVITNNGREVVSNPLRYDDGKYSIDFADLTKKIKDSGAKMLIFCSPHNPIGRVWTKDELNQLADICMEHDVLVVSDEIHSDLIFTNHKHIPLSKVSKNMAARTIVCVAPSKTFNLAGMKTSFTIITNQEIREAFQKNLDDSFQIMANPFSVTAAEAAYQYGEEWLKQCLEYIKGNIDYLKAYVDKYLPKIQVVEPEGTYLVWLDCRDIGLSAEELFDFFVKKAKVAINKGDEFGVEGEGFVRMNMACRQSTLMEALNRIKSVM